MSRLPARTASLIAPLALAFAAGPAAAVPPLAAAEQLMNFGEAQYPNYFPGHPVTLNFGPFRYRLYSNGVLLGVAVGADPRYTLNGVYALGGEFGGYDRPPLFLGTLGQFITPAEPGPGPTGLGNGCHDLNLLTGNGNVTTVTYEWSGPISGDTTVDNSVLSTTTFEGQPATETLVRQRGTLFENGLPSVFDRTEKVYLRKTGTAEVTFHGTADSSTVTTNDYIATTTNTTTYSPLWADRSYALAIGESLTVNRSATTKRVVTYSNSLPSTTNTFGSTLNEVVTYVGRELINVPAGNYQTCRYERFDAAKPNSVTVDWLIVGKGLLAKRETHTFGAGGTLTMQRQVARAVLINTEPF